MDVRLVIFKADGTQKTIGLKPGRYLIGRRSEASLRIPLPSVSRDHCELVHDGAMLTVRDLGSSNGTFKNQQRIKQATLSAGDRLGIGPFVMTIQIDGKPAVVSPPQRIDEESDVMLETPPQGMPVPRAGGPLPASDLEETITKSSPPAGVRSTQPHSEDSSIFEFDFDFEDEDRPKL